MIHHYFRHLDDADCWERDDDGTMIFWCDRGNSSHAVWITPSDGGGWAVVSSLITEDYQTIERMTMDGVQGWPTVEEAFAALCQDHDAATDA